MPAEGIPVHRSVAAQRAFAGAARVAAGAVPLRTRASALVRLLYPLGPMLPARARAQVPRREARRSLRCARHPEDGRRVPSPGLASDDARESCSCGSHSRPELGAEAQPASSRIAPANGRPRSGRASPGHGAATSSSPIIPRSACSRMMTVKHPHPRVGFPSRTRKFTVFRGNVDRVSPGDDARGRPIDGDDLEAEPKEDETGGPSRWCSRSPTSTVSRVAAKGVTSGRLRR